MDEHRLIIGVAVMLLSAIVVALGIIADRLSQIVDLLRGMADRD